MLVNIKRLINDYFEKYCLYIYKKQNLDRAFLNN